MSAPSTTRYWVFNQQQLEAALAAFIAGGGVMEDEIDIAERAIREFLASDAARVHGLIGAE